jgi:hypothetical protein
MTLGRGKLKSMEKNLYQWHTVHHKSHMECPRIEFKPLQWEAYN